MKIAAILILLAIATVSASTNSTDPFSKINNMIENILKSLDNFLNNLKELIKVHIISISKTLSIILGLIGALLYFSGINKYSGRGMIIGAILLYIFAEFVNSI